jgi:hypothetical protein
MACTLLNLLACKNATTNTSQSTDTTNQRHNYAYDADFLVKHTRQVVELQNPEGTSKLLLSADYQGRVMTSTASGDTGISFGWINYKLISSGEKNKQFNPVGGENRFWLGPEGGQYALYFQKGDSFNLAHWRVPAILDTSAYEISSSNQTQASFTAHADLVNYKGTSFKLDINREITLLNRADFADALKITIPESVHFVGYLAQGERATLHLAVGHDDADSSNGRDDPFPWR